MNCGFACAIQAERLLAWDCGLAAADLGGRGRRRAGSPAGPSVAGDG